MAELPPIPLILRTRLAHATLQAIADSCGADILHIKGAAVDASLLPARPEAPADASAEERALPRLSADADVLVRPAHLNIFQRELRRYGWQRMTRFNKGGGADHSADYWHKDFGWADVHQGFPGIYLDSRLAFARLWQNRSTRDLAHRACNVPSVHAQRLLLLIHAARNGPSRAADVQNAWTNATAEERAGVSALAHELEAEVALAAVTGHIGEYSDRREHDLWRLLAEGGAGKFEIWIARTKSAATVAERLHVMASPFRLKTDSVALALGRQPTTREILRAYGNRLRLNIASAWVVARQAASRRPPGLPASHRDATDTRLP